MERRAAASRSRSACTSATRGASQPSDSNAAVAIETDTVEIEPGGRYGSIAAIAARAPMAKPTRRPARPYALLSVRTTMSRG
jgi:hypothetical protein